MILFLQTLYSQLVVKNSDPDKLILNGRAAFCAGRDDMSSEEDEEQVDNFVDIKHKFAQPENFNFSLESGTIPDAAMIHAARKRRQKAREQGNVNGIIDCSTIIIVCLFR